MPLLRKIIFYILALSYIIVCPLLILYSLGYIIKPEVKQHIIETGDISLATIPTGASIYVNGKLFADTTPSLLDKLEPTDYDISVKLKNYQSWNATVPVKAGETTVLEDILLIPDTWEAKPVLPGTFEKLIPVSDTPFFLVAGGALLKDYFICSYNGDSYPLVKSDSTYAELAVLNYFTVRKSTSFVFHVGSSDNESFLWINFDGQEAGLKNITDLLPGKTQWVKWDPSNENNLFSFQEGTVNRIKVKAGALFPDYIKNTRGYGIRNRLIYILRNDNTLASMDYKKDNIKIILDDPALGNSIFSIPGNFQIMPFLNDIIFFWGDKGELLSNHLPYRFVDSGLVGMEFDEGNERVLLWRKDKIGILDFSQEVTGNVPFEKGPRLTWIYSKGNNIEQVFWVNSASHVLFRDGNTVFLIEVETYYSPHITNLFEVKQDSSIFYFEKTGTVYYIESSKGDLVSAEIISGKGH